MKTYTFPKISIFWKHIFIVFFLLIINSVAFGQSRDEIRRQLIEARGKIEELSLVVLELRIKELGNEQAIEEYENKLNYLRRKVLELIEILEKLDSIITRGSSEVMEESDWKKFELVLNELEKLKSQIDDEIIVKMISIIIEDKKEIIQDKKEIERLKREIEEYKTNASWFRRTLDSLRKKLR